MVQSKEKLNNSEKVIEIIISEEEEYEENLNSQVNQHSIKYTPKQTLLSEKNTNLTLQLPTDDSNLL